MRFVLASMGRKDTRIATAKRYRGTERRGFDSRLRQNKRTIRCSGRGDGPGSCEAHVGNDRSEACRASGSYHRMVRKIKEAT